MAQEKPTDGGGGDSTTTPNLDTLNTSWNAVYQDTQTTSNALQFPELAANHAILACNTLLEYLDGISGQTKNLHIDGDAVNGVTSTGILMDQFNMLSQENLANVITAHTTLVQGIVATLGYAGGVYKYQDTSSASNISQAFQQIESLVTNSTSKNQSSGTGSSAASQLPLQNADLVTPSAISVPTTDASFNAYGQANLSGDLPGSGPVTLDFQSGGADSSQWASVWNYTNGSIDYAQLPDGSWLDYATSGQPGYSGQLNTAPNSADIPSSMQWSEMYQLSQVEPQQVANSSLGWYYLATQLKQGFGYFSKGISDAMQEGAQIAGDQTVWSGNGKDAALSAMNDYIATQQPLVDAMNYQGWVLEQCADFVASTAARMPYFDGQPSSTSGPGLKYLAPGTVVVPDGAVTTRTTYSGGKDPSQNINSAIISIPKSSNKVAVYYQDGVTTPATADQVGSFLLSYYQGQYNDWYYGSYSWTSSNVPALSVPAFVTNDSGSGKGSGSSSASASISATPGDGAGQTVYVPYTPSTATSIDTGTGTGTGTGATADLAAAEYNTNTAASAVNADAGSGTATTSGTTTTSDTGSTAAADSPASTDTSALSAAAGAAQQLAGGVQQGLGQTGQQQKLAQAAAMDAAEKIAEPGDAATAGLARNGGAGEVESVGAGGSTQSQLGTTETAKLFPRAGALAEGEEETLGRAGVAPAEGEGAGGSPGGMGSPAAAGQGKEQKAHRSPGYLNSRRHLDEAMGDAPLTTVSLVDDE